MSEDNVSEPAAEAQPSWSDEWRKFWNFLPHKALFGALLLAWVALFQFWGNSTFGYIDTPSLFVWMYNAYTAPASEDGHGTLIPFVVLGLLWWKRRELMALRLEPRNGALILLMLALSLHAVGFIVQQPRLSIVAFFSGLYALMGYCWGYGWLRRTVFPWFLFAFCVPVGSLVTVVTLPLRLVVTNLAVGFATIFLQLDVICQGTLIFDTTKSYTYDVAPACSGIRSLVALFVLATIYAFVSVRAPWRRAIIVLASVPLAVAGNVLRIIMVIVIGDVYGEQAGLKVEQNLGLVTFFLIGIVGLMFITRLLDEPAPEAGKDHEG